jgi:hypothetical protein
MIVVCDIGPLHYLTKRILIPCWGLTPHPTTDKLGFTWVFCWSFHLSKAALCATPGE